MKKLILFAAFATISGIATAQVSFGVQAGAAVTMGKYQYDDAAFTGATTWNQRNQVNFGFTGGFVAEIPLGTMLAFRPELNFLQQGTKYSYKVNYGFGEFELTQKMNLNYIQVPLNVVYKIPTGAAGNFYFGLGPSLEVGLFGKNRVSSASDPTDPDYNRSVDVKFDGKKQDEINNGSGDDRTHFKRFDVAGNVVAGYKSSMGIFVNLRYSHGFININPDKDNNDPEDRGSYRNSNLSLGVGYAFGGKSAKKK